MDHRPGSTIAKRVITYVLMIIVMAWILFPLFWLVIGAFKTMPDLITVTPKLIFMPTLENFVKAFTEKTFHMFIRNSAIIAPISVALAMVLGLPAAYALARNPSKGKENIGNWILSLRMLPPIAIALPLFILYSPKYLDILNTHIGLILIYTAMNIPLVVWIIRGFIEEIPVELEEVAMIAGLSRFKAFLKIIVPLSFPGIMSSAIICLILTWNEYLFAIIMTGTEDAATVTVGLQQYMGFKIVDWGGIFAASIIIVAPVIVFMYMVQDYLVRGLTMGAVKD